MLVKDLEGALLDYWVARAEGYDAQSSDPETILRGKWVCVGVDGCFITREVPSRVSNVGIYHVCDVPFKPSTDWSQGGPIIEREGIELTRGWGAHVERNQPSGGMITLPGTHQYGPTPLIAAMRCFVASKFGSEVPDASTG